VQLIPKCTPEGGVVAAFEFMASNSAIQNKIRIGNEFTIDNDIKSGAKYGMQLLDTHLQTLVRRGKINQEDAMLYANNPSSFTE
jgi:twitching motility protein PilT